MNFLKRFTLKKISFNLSEDFLPLFFLGLTVIGIHFMASTTFLGEIQGFGVLGLIGLLLFKRIRFHESGYRMPFLLLFLSALFAAIFSPLFELAIGEVFSVLAMVLAYFILSAAIGDNPEKIEKVLDWLITLFFAGLLINLFVALYQYIHFNIFHFKVTPFSFLLTEMKTTHRSYGMFFSRSGTSVFSAYLSVLLPTITFLLIAYFKKSSIKGKVLKIILLCLLFALFVTTRSRALLLIFSTVFAMIIFFNAGPKRWIYLMLFVFVFGVAMVSVPSLQKTTISLFDKNHSSNIDHIFTKVIAFRLISERPLTGWGGGLLNARLKQSPDGTWKNVHGKYKTKAELNPQTNFPIQIHNEARQDGVIVINTPHDIYLTYFLEFGVFGFFALIFLFFSCWQKLDYASRFASVKYALLARGLKYGFISFMLYSLFQDSLKAPIMAAMFIFILIIARKLEELGLAKTQKKRESQL